jgi:hypothetical protein
MAQQKGRTSTLEVALAPQISHEVPYLDETCQHRHEADDTDETVSDREQWGKPSRAHWCFQPTQDLN